MFAAKGILTDDGLSRTGCCPRRLGWVFSEALEVKKDERSQVVVFWMRDGAFFALSTRSLFRPNWLTSLHTSTDGDDHNHHVTAVSTIVSIFLLLIRSIDL